MERGVPGREVTPRHSRESGNPASNGAADDGAGTDDDGAACKTVIPA